MTMEPSRVSDREPDAEITALFETVQQLQERIAELRPDLIVKVDFGQRLRTDAVSFRDHFDKGPKFDNVFDKAGDGFINVHGVDLGREIILDA